MQAVLILVAGLALAPAPSAPAPAHRDTSYDVRGDGGVTCATWATYRTNAAANNVNAVPALVAESWVLGYLTAYNYFGPGDGHVGSGVDNRAVLAWVDTYCAQHPLDSLATAAHHLIDGLHSGAH